MSIKTRCRSFLLGIDVFVMPSVLHVHTYTSSDTRTQSSDTLIVHLTLTDGRSHRRWLRGQFGVLAGRQWRPNRRLPRSRAARVPAKWTLDGGSDATLGLGLAWRGPGCNEGQDWVGTARDGQLQRHRRGVAWDG